MIGGNDMKKLLTFVLALALCFSCLSMSGCTLIKQWSRGNLDFRVTIDDAFGFGEINFEIASYHYITVKIHNQDIDGETYKDIDIKYNQENAVVAYAYERKHQNEIVFKAYFYELGEDDELSFTYNGKTVKVKYNVTDYDFSKHGYVGMDSIDDLDKYPEFKKMLTSVKRHEFTEPYVGFEDMYSSTFSDSYGETITVYSLPWSEDEADPDYIATDYTQYLKDSVYYPAKFDMIHENHVSDVNVAMTLLPTSDVSAGSKREVMRSFYVSYSVIDPCCTNPQHPVRYMRFNATVKDNAMKYADNGKAEGTYPSLISILLDKYPERFFVTEIGELTVYILLSEDSGAQAYFEDETYFYSLSATYEN